MMRMLFAMMDSDGDGTISLQEFQAAHDRIFKAIDANKDGRLTLEEIQAFMQEAGFLRRCSDSWRTTPSGGRGRSVWQQRFYDAQSRPGARPGGLRDELPVCRFHSSLCE